MSKYSVTYNRDEDGWWLASVVGVKGCHSQGRTVSEANRRIREALALFVDDASTAMLVDIVKLPASVERAVRAYAAERERAEGAHRRAATAARQAVRALQSGSLKLSARDAARVLGLSHQRVHQLGAEKC